MTLVALSVIERYRAVMAVSGGVIVSEVGAHAGVSRQSVHAWLARSELQGVGGTGARLQAHRLNLRA